MIYELDAIVLQYPFHFHLSVPSLVQVDLLRAEIGQRNRTMSEAVIPSGCEAKGAVQPARAPSKISA